MTDKQKTGIELIAEERRRQIDVEGWTADLDDVARKNGVLALAAAAYALAEVEALDGLRATIWPWHELWWKPGDGTPAGRIRELQKAGALIAAEIDRLQRMVKMNESDGYEQANN